MQWLPANGICPWLIGAASHAAAIIDQRRESGDLGLDKETKGRFRAAVSALKGTGEDGAGSAAWCETEAFEAESARSKLQDMQLLL
jgi:hypothetical protein